MKTTIQIIDEISENLGFETTDDLIQDVSPDFLIGYVQDLMTVYACEVLDEVNQRYKKQQNNEILLEKIINEVKKEVSEED